MKFFDKVMNAFDSMVDCSEDMANANLFLSNKNDLY